MVKLAATQSDDVMLSHTAEIDFAKSMLIAKDAFGEGVSIWRSPIKSTDGIAFWIGPNGVPSREEIYAYLALVPTLLGSLPALEAKKGWTRDTWRRRGLGSALLRHAAQVAPLLSDSDSMTSEAFKQWCAIDKLRRRWWDTVEARFVDVADVPPEDRLTGFEDGLRWLMVLDLA